MDKIKFGTDGWRAVIADSFTFQNLGAVAEGISKYLDAEKRNKKGIVIGYDNRFLSEDFARHCAFILSKNKIKSYLANTSIPTPLTAFFVIDMNLDGGIMITASHNPPKYNGIKFIPFYGGPAEDDITKKIENNIKKIEFKYDYGDSSKIDIGVPDGNLIKIIKDNSRYKKHLHSIIDMEIIKEVKPKAAIDTMFGAGSIILPEIINSGLDLEADIFNNQRDPLFGGKLPDPSEKNMDFLKEIVLENNLDLGFALDGDADRFGIIDGKGIYISPNNAISIILYFMIENKKIDANDIAVRTVATTHLIDSICSERKIEVLETPVGFKHIAKAMRKGNVIIGGEESGGLSIKGHIPEKDGIFACLKMLEIQAFLKRKSPSFYISDYLDEIYSRYGYYYNIRLDLEVEQKNKSKIINNFLSFKNAEIEGISVTGINDIDGAKLIFENKSWLLVRPSGTEPLIRCYIESNNQDFFKKLINFARKNIK